MKAVAGMKMSYQVQQAIMASRDTIIRGFRQDESNSALCSHLFTMVRGNRQHRRAFLISLLNLFDDSAVRQLNSFFFIVYEGLQLLRSWFHFFIEVSITLYIFLFRRKPLFYFYKFFEQTSSLLH